MSLGMLGKYERIDVLGHGASGIVYLAQDTLLKKQVALKEISAQGEERQRVLEEARVLDRLNHPNIVAVNSVDIINGKVVIDMEYVDGSNLLDILRDTEGPLPIVDSIQIAAQVLDALAYAHRQRTVHRDIKPANILITEQRSVKLADFGLAQVLGTNSYAGGAGTFAYMAPEDFDQGGRSDRQSDIWAAGIILYEMLTGFRPFTVLNVRDPFSWARAVANDEIKPPSYYVPEIPAEIDEIVLRALERDKDHRYADAALFAQDLLGTISLVRAKQPALITPFLAECIDIEGFLKHAPSHWDEAIEVMTDGSLRAWLCEIDEKLLAEVAEEMENGSDDNVDSRLHEFLYRAGLEVDEAARDSARAGADLMSVGKFVEAVEKMQAAVNLDPSRVSYFRLLAQAARGAHDSELALETLQRANQLFPSDRSIQQELQQDGGVFVRPGTPPATAANKLTFISMVAEAFCVLPFIAGLAAVLPDIITPFSHRELLPFIGFICCGLLCASVILINLINKLPLAICLLPSPGILLLIWSVVQISHPPLPDDPAGHWIGLACTVLITISVPASQIICVARASDLARRKGVWYGAIILVAILDSLMTLLT